MCVFGGQTICISYVCLGLWAWEAWRLTMGKSGNSTLMTKSNARPCGLTNLKSASGLGISGYSTMRKMRKRRREWRVNTQRRRKKVQDIEGKESVCDGERQRERERWGKRNSNAVQAEAVWLYCVCC